MYCLLMCKCTDHLEHIWMALELLSGNLTLALSNLVYCNYLISGCSFLYLLLNGACKAVCPKGYFEDLDKGICVNCHSTCATCSGPLSDDCETCSALNPKLYEGTCLEECPAGTYYQTSDKECQGEVLAVVTPLTHKGSIILVSKCSTIKSQYAIFATRWRIFKATTADESHLHLHCQWKSIRRLCLCLWELCLPCPWLKYIVFSVYSSRSLITTRRGQFD